LHEISLGDFVLSDPSWGIFTGVAGKTTASAAVAEAVIPLLGFGGVLLLILWLFEDLLLFLVNSIILDYFFVILSCAYYYSLFGLFRPWPVFPLVCWLIDVRDALPLGLAKIFSRIFISDPLVGVFIFLGYLSKGSSC